MKFRWCVIGAGGIADRRVMPAMLKEKGFELVALCDRTPEKAERLGAKYAVKFYTDEETMLRENPCDGVYIASPVALHLPQALTALRYGCNVLLEKPIAMNAEEGERLAAAFRREKKTLSVGYMMKFHNLHAMAKKMIRDGEIGRVGTVRFFFACWYPDLAGAWRQEKALGGGGSVMDLGVHCIELAEFLLGEEITEAKGYLATRTFSYEVEDTGAFLFRTAGGVIGSVETGFNVPDACASRLEIYGSEGSVICEGTLGQEEKGKLTLLRAPQGEYDAMQTRGVVKSERYYGAGGDLFRKELRRFAQRVREKAFDEESERAVRVQRIVDGIYNEKR